MYDNRAPTIDGIERVLMAAREPRYTATDIEVSGASRVDGWGGKLTVKIWARESLDYGQTKEEISRGYPTFVDNVSMIQESVNCRY